MMNTLQVIKRGNELSKYDQIIDYLKQDSGYWLNNDIWDVTKDFFVGKRTNGIRSLNFTVFKNETLKNEVKFYFVFNFKNQLIKNSSLISFGTHLCKLAEFLKHENSFFNLDKENTSKAWKSFIVNKNLKIHPQDGRMNSYTNFYINFFTDYYDTREEIEKDIWYAANIPGVKIRATQRRQTTRLNFTDIPEYYRETVKKYFKTIITKKSFSTCFNLLVILNYFFNYFITKKSLNGFIENLTRKDIEGYIFYLMNDRKDKNLTEKTKYIAWVRTFLEYIQMAQYDKAPIKEVGFLIFQDDIPKRELNGDVIKRVKFIPEPVVKQIDNNIMDLDKPDFIPIYILLRETGWRGTDVLNLRYDNCLEKIWNKKEDKYNYYLCGEITKTGIAELKIPVRDKVSEMVEKCIFRARGKSTELNNPKKYLFNIYEGKHKGQPYQKATITNTIKRLIVQKDIRDADGQLYHFKMHSLRHTRAKEYVEQGMGISVIQQILGHRSLQMTVHYATVTENTLYEKWKQTEDLDLFRINSYTHEIQQVDINSEEGESLVRYEYVKKNLDAVRVPFGVCFKSSKTLCKQQMNHCLTCASFCTTVENIPEYEEEIEKVKKQIEISDRCGRELWAAKNRTYLKLLEELLKRVKQQKIVHKNSASREDAVNG